MGSSGRCWSLSHNNVRKHTHGKFHSTEVTSIADGTCPIPVATTGAGTYDFAVETRQVFSHLTGEYTDFPHNKTTLINTNVVSFTSYE